MSVVSIPPQHADFPPSNSEPSVGQGEMDDSLVALRAALEKMATYARKTRLQLRPHFLDFDRHKQGSVSATQFARVLSTVGLSVTPPLLSLLCERYALPNDATKLSYRAYLADLEAVAQAQQQAQHEAVQRAQAGPTLDFERSAALSPLRPRQVADPNRTGLSVHAAAAFAAQDPHASAPLTAEKLLRKIQTLCQQKRILLTDAFADFDPLRRGTVTLQQFRRVLNTSGFALTDPEANLLVQSYLTDSEPAMVAYKRFLSDVLAPFVPSGAEKAPLGSTAPFQPYRLEEQETPQLSLSEAERARLEHLLDELGYAAHTRRILVKPSFAALDQSRRGLVTARQFASVLLSVFPGVRCSERDVELLAARYRRADQGVSYASFLRELEARERNAGEYAKTLHPSHAAQQLANWSPPPLQPLPAARGASVVAGMVVGGPRANEQPPELEAVLAEVRAQLARTRHTMGEELFRGAGFDALNKGRVSRAQFSRCLSAAAGLILQPTQVATLAEAYADREFPEEVNYRRLVADLSNIPRF